MTARRTRHPHRKWDRFHRRTVAPFDVCTAQRHRQCRPPHHSRRCFFGRKGSSSSGDGNRRRRSRTLDSSNRQPGMPAVPVSSPSARPGGGGFAGVCCWHFCSCCLRQLEPVHESRSLCNGFVVVSAAAVVCSSSIPLLLLSFSFSFR